MSAAASIVSANSARRDLVRLATTDGADSGFGSGTPHLHALLEHLAVVEASGSASLRTMIDVVQRDGQGALVLVVSQTADDDTTDSADGQDDADGVDPDEGPADSDSDQTDS